MQRLDSKAELFTLTDIVSPTPKDITIINAISDFGMGLSIATGNLKTLWDMGATSLSDNPLLDNDADTDIQIQTRFTAVNRSGVELLIPGMTWLIQQKHQIVDSGNSTRPSLNFDEPMLVGALDRSDIVEKDELGADSIIIPLLDTIFPEQYKCFDLELPISVLARLMNNPQSRPTLRVVPYGLVA